MKPRIGSWVHWNESAGNRCIVKPALIIECALKGAVGLHEGDFDVTLEVHGVRETMDGALSVLVPDTYVVVDAKFSPALSGHSTAVEHWTWPRDT